MKRILLITIVLFVGAVQVIAQQEIQSSQFILNPFLLNPAYSSMDDNYDFKFGHRSQWVGVEGAPNTTYFSFDTPVNKPRWGRTHPGDFHDWHGTGLAVIRDRIGPYSNTRVNVNYSYNLKLHQGIKYGYQHKDGLRMALGAHVGWNQFRVDENILGMSKTSTGTQIANAGINNDPTFRQLNGNGSSAIDFTFGGLLYYGDRYFLGASTTQLLQKDVALTDGYTMARHYFFTGTIKQAISEQWYIIPAAIFKYVKGAPLSANLSVQVDYEDRYFAGVGYRVGDAATFLLGMRYKWGGEVKNFRVDKHRYIVELFYSYDATVSRLRNRDFAQRSTGSHEITLGFLIPPMFHERNAEDTW